MQGHYTCSMLPIFGKRFSLRFEFTVEQAILEGPEGE
jgi:hypothetical protein